MKRARVRLLYVILAFSYCTLANGQEQDPTKHLQVGFGGSLSGTGDVVGLSYDTRFSDYFRKNTAYYIELGGSIHDGKFPIYYVDSSGEKIDGSIYYTTAGVQLCAGISQSFLRSKNHELGIRVGLLLRYQSTSYWDWVEVIYPPVSGLAVPVSHFINTSPHRTLSIGGKGYIFYTFTVKQRFSISLNGVFQVDTNSDIFSDVGISLGRRF